MNFPIPIDWNAVVFVFAFCSAVYCGKELLKALRKMASEDMDE
jgi:hypothetical protein